jgi:hypothetical protein
MRRSGFIAQEVELAAVQSGYNFSGIIKPKSSTGHYSLSYDAFVVPLVKAFQELHQKVETLQIENDLLRQESQRNESITTAQQNKIKEQDDKMADLQLQLDEIKNLLRQSGKRPRR